MLMPMKNEILRALAPFRRRLRLGRLCRGAAWGFLCGAAAALLLLAVTLFVPLRERLPAAALAAAGGTVLGALVNALRPVTDFSAARAADACGLQERAVTALELASATDSPLANAQRQDAAERLRKLSPREIPLRVPGRILAAGGALLLLCVLPALLSGPGPRQAAARKALEEQLASFTEQIDRAEALEEESLPEADRNELRKLTADLKRELASSRDTVEALVAADRAENRLEELRQKTAGDALDAYQRDASGGNADASAGSGEGSEGKAGDDSGKTAEKSGGDLPEQPAQTEEGAEGSQAASSESQAGNASGASGSGNTSEASSRQPMNAGALSQTLSAMKAALSGQQNASSGQTAQMSGGMQAGSMASSSSSSSSSSGSPGSGSGQGGQSPGSGAGAGTTNQDEGGKAGQSSSGSSGGGNRPPEYREGEYETIYDPERAEAAFRDVMTEQNRLGEDSVQLEAGPGKGTLEGNVPYRQVVGEYAREAVEAADSAALTGEQRSWVDEYFRLLTDLQ